jgi:hypothetical protein
MIKTRTGKHPAHLPLSHGVTPDGEKTRAPLGSAYKTPAEKMGTDRLLLLTSRLTDGLFLPHQ